MDPLERIQKLRPPFPANEWAIDDFLQSAAEGRRRWADAQVAFHVSYPMFDDGVHAIMPDFVLNPAEIAAAKATLIPGRRNVDNRIALWFLKWDRCPRTCQLSNPYEPWLAIWEHGGSFAVEHGQFVDVCDATGRPAGMVVVQRA